MICTWPVWSRVADGSAVIALFCSEYKSLPAADVGPVRLILPLLLDFVPIIERKELSFELELSTEPKWLILILF